MFNTFQLSLSVFSCHGDELDNDYDLDLDTYQPIRPVISEHDVTQITPRLAGIKLHTLQCLHHGTTIIHWEEDNSRSCMCYMKLESDNATVTWRKSTWSSLRSSAGSPSLFILRGDTETNSVFGMWAKYVNGETICDSLEEGFIDINIVKNVFLCDDLIDLPLISKRHGLNPDDLSQAHNCLCILYGSFLAENKCLFFVSPTNVAQMWYSGLKCLIAGAEKLRWQTDKRIQWLKTQYLQLYYENEKCQGPTPAEAIKVR